MTTTPYSSFDQLENMKINCKRTIKRIISTLKTLGKKPELSICAASENKAEAKAIYRLLGNSKFKESAVLDAQKENLLNKLKEENTKIILSVQDTTEVDYTNLKATEGLGVHGTKTTSKGLIVHTSVAVSTDGVVKGILAQKIWSRSEEGHGRKHDRKNKPITEKESYKWLELMEKSSENIGNEIQVIQVCDRESDIFEFFKKAQDEKKSFLIRAVQNRKTTEELKTFDRIKAEKPAGKVKVKVPRDTRNAKPEREAELEIRYCKVALEMPAHIRKYYEDKEEVEATIILAKEVNPPSGTEGIEWYLLTNLDVNSMEEAYEKVKWYVHRWKIERFHYILKSGCKIEELQERSAEKLEKLIFLYSLIAAKIMEITYIAREYPEADCEKVLEAEEWKLLYKITNQTRELPKKKPCAKEIVGYLAKLGGFLGRKSDGDPGVKVIWRGLRELNTLLEHYQYLN